MPAAHLEGLMGAQKNVKNKSKQYDTRQQPGGLFIHVIFSPSRFCICSIVGHPQNENQQQQNEKNFYRNKISCWVKYFCMFFFCPTSVANFFARLVSKEFQSISKNRQTYIDLNTLYDFVFAHLCFFSFIKTNKKAQILSLIKIYQKHCVRVNKKENR